MNKAMAVLLAGALTACNAADEEAGPACDRACLIELTNKYVAGIESQSIEGIPFSDEAIIVENLERIRPGEGLWADTTGKGTDFGVVVPDETRQTAGWIGMVERDGEPAIVALRLKLDPRGSIVEAEHLWSAVQQDRMANLQSPRAGLLAEVPEASRMAYAALIAIGASYYDALDDNDASLHPFADDCERRENGMVAAGGTAGGGFDEDNAVASDCKNQMASGMFGYIDTIDNRRVFAADPVTGLVMGLSHFHHPMDFEPYPVKTAAGTTVMFSTDDPMQFDPFDLPAAHVFKVGADGKVHEIEAMGFLAPLNSPTGWE